MKFGLKSTVAGMAAAAVVLATAGAAFAATPPYEPDAQTQGACNPATANCSIRFYNAAGVPITGGLITDVPFAKYVQADQPALQPTDNHAVVQIATPVIGVPSGNWQNGPLSPSRAYPVAGIPAPLNNANPTADLSTSIGNKSIQSWITNNPNNDTSTTDGYKGLYQIRISTLPSNTPNYYSADILVTGNSWQLVYPNPQSTSGNLTVSPASPQQAGTAVTLTDAISPINVTGTVQFKDGSANIGAPVVVAAGGTASTTTSSLTVAGSPHSLTAVFIPGDPVAFNGSTSNAQPYTINPAPIQNTQTALAIDPGAGQAFSMVTFTATVSPTAAPGSVTFKEEPTGTVVGNAGPGNGTFVATNSGLAAGGHSVQAFFTPTDPTAFNPSSSPIINFTLGAPACAGCTDQQTIIATIPAGTLVITTPYTPTSPLNLGTLALNPAGSEFSATATFTGITITDTRAGNQAWTANAQSGNLTNGSGGTINSQNVGLTGLVIDPVAGNALPGAPGNVTTFDNPAANPALAPAAAGSQGLGGPTTHPFAHAIQGDGSIGFHATMTLNAPSSTPAGLYTGTVTFTIG